MTEMPSPVDVPAGHVVRVVVPHRTYVSPVMSPAEARIEKERITTAVAGFGSASGLVAFATGDGWLTSIRARQITAVEAGPPPAHREQPRPQPAGQVHVHLHVGPDVDQAAAEAAVEATAGLIPTPAALAGRRRPR